MRYGNSPYASPSANGVGQVGVPSGYRDLAFDYIFNQTLNANANGDFQLGVHTDSDFHWRAVVVSSTGAFSVKFSDSDWYDLSSGNLLSTLIQGDPSSPWPIFPEIIIPAGGRIGIEQLTDLSGAQNTINIMFRGAKRFPL